MVCTVLSAEAGEESGGIEVSENQIKYLRHLRAEVSRFMVVVDDIEEELINHFSQRFPQYHFLALKLHCELVLFKAFEKGAIALDSRLHSSVHCALIE